MRSSTASKSKGGRLFALSVALVFVLAAVSLFVGKYPLTISGILTEGVEQRVFLRMRLPRMLVGLFGGFALGAAGYVFQTVFKNPLAAPDMIGVTSGASVGAAAAILFASSALVVTVSAFVGAVAALLLTAAISSLIPHKDRAGVVLAGVAVHAIAQTAIVVLKLELNLHAIDAAGSINLIHSHLSRVHNSVSVNSSASGGRPDTADLQRAALSSGRVSALCRSCIIRRICCAVRCSRIGTAAGNCRKSQDCCQCKTK